MTARNESDRFVNVVFPRPLPHPLTYHVPPEWRDAARPGCRVRAPLGRSLETGVIVEEVPANLSLPSGIKPLAGLVDPDTPVPEDVLALSRWIAEYYICSPGEALAPAIAMPGGEAVREYSPAPIDWETTRTPPRLTPTQERILAAVARRKRFTSAHLKRLRLSPAVISAALRDLVDKSVLSSEWVLSAPPVPADAVITRLLPDRESLIPMDWRNWLEDQLRDGPVPWRELASRRKNSRGMLRDWMHREILDWDPMPAPLTPLTGPPIRAEPGPEDFDAGQRGAYARIKALLDSGEATTALLWGPTGSGKTAVYCAAIREAWARNRTALLLVPAIGLAGPMIERLRVTLKEEIGVWHSALTPAQRYWMARRVAQGRCRLVVGARSAVFAPLPRIGLIIVDEEHADAYKQSDPAPRYHARDCAVVRARLNRALCVLGSATPSCESYHNAATGKYELIQLTQRVAGRVMPLVRLIDLSHRHLTDEDSWVTPEMREAIAGTIHKGRKVIIFLNRRGYATMVVCRECGHHDLCPDCGLTLTFHRADRSFRCHICTYRQPTRDVCPKCGGADFLLRGIGTQKIEEIVGSLDPAIRPARLDADVAAKRGAAQRILSSFATGEVNLLLGTQMVAKGLDVPGVGLVGVIWADQQMAFPDFRAEERTFQLITQVAGRAGRDRSVDGLSEVAVQTFRPEHDLIELAAAQDARLFFTRELPRRKPLRYPPFSRLILLAFVSEDKDAAIAAALRFATTWREGIKESRKRPGQMLGPSPAAVPRKAGRHQVHILLKCDALSAARALINAYRDSESKRLQKEAVHLIIDVDPVDFW